MELKRQELEVAFLRLGYEMSKYVLSYPFLQIMPQTLSNTLRHIIMFGNVIILNRPRGILDPQPTPWSPPAASGLSQAMLSDSTLPMREASGKQHTESV